jgi:hypothetical protein
MHHTPMQDEGDLFHPTDLPPPDVDDPVVELYMKDVDRTLLRENLKLSAEQRLQKFVAFMHDLDEVREAGRRMRESNATKV